MGLFTTPLVGDLMKGVFSIFDDVHTSAEEKAEIRLKLMQVGMSADLAQLEVNKEEAKSGLLFVSGWRPFIGWVCGSAFAYNYIIYHFIASAMFYYGQFSGTVIDLSGLPKLDMAEMIPVLMGMLGLGGLRTYEKREGIARTAIAVKDGVKRAVKPTGLVD